MLASRFHVAARNEITPTLFDNLGCAPDAAWSTVGSFEPSRLDGLVRDCCNENGLVRTRLAEIALLYVWSERISLSGRISLDDALLLLTDEIRLDSSLAPSTSEKLSKEVRTFIRTLRACDLKFMNEVTSEIVLSYVTGGTSRRGELRAAAPTTQRNRLWVVRSIVQILYEHECWDGRDLVSESIRSVIDEPSRPLTNEELQAVRDVSYHWLFPTRRPLVVALAEAGGSPMEIALVESSDIDLAAGTVRFKGSTSRTNSLSPVVLEVIKSVIADGYRFERRLVTGGDLSVSRATQSVNTELSRVIRDAGLRNVQGAVGKSIRLHAAEQILTSNGLFAAARFLGADSLDRVAASLRFDCKSVQ